MQKKYSERKRDDKERASGQTTGVVLIIISVFLLICTLTNGLVLGDIGTIITRFLLGIFGYITFPILLFMFIYGVLKVRNKKLTVRKKYVVGTLVALFSLIEIAQILSTVGSINGDFSAYIGSVYKVTTLGGVAFGLLAYTFNALIGTVFSCILLGLVIVATIFFMSAFYADLPSIKARDKKRKSKKESSYVSSRYDGEDFSSGARKGGLCVITLDKTGESAPETISEEGSYDEMTSSSSFVGTSEPMRSRDYVMSERERARKILFGDEDDIKRRFSPQSLIASTPITSASSYPRAKTNVSETSIPEVAVPAPKAFEHKYVAGEIINGDELSAKMAEAEKPAEERGSLEHTTGVSSSKSVERVDSAFSATFESYSGEKTTADTDIAYNPGPIVNGDYYVAGHEVPTVAAFEEIVESPLYTPIGMEKHESDKYDKSEKASEKTDYEATSVEENPKETRDEVYKVVDSPVSEDSEQTSYVAIDEFEEDVEEDFPEETESKIIEEDSYAKESVESDYDAYEYDSYDERENDGNDSAADLSDDNSEYFVSDDGSVDDEAEEETGDVDLSIIEDESVFDEDEAVDGRIVYDGESDSEPSVRADATVETEEQKRSDAFEKSTTSFTISDEVEDLSEKSYDNPNDTTGYYTAVDAPISASRESVSSARVKSPTKSGVSENQIDIDSFAQKKAETEVAASAPPVKPKKPGKYHAPSMELLVTESMNPEASDDEIQEKITQLEQTLEQLNVPAKVNDYTVGPAITRYELDMPQGMSVKKIENLESDIRYALACKGQIRIESPIPGKRAVGIEVPNDNIFMVALKDIIDSKEFKNSPSPLTIALGKDIQGRVKFACLEKLPHLLIAGATGSGKSSCLNCLLISLIYKSSPSDVRLILIDPKRVEFTLYSGLPHMLIPNAITDVDQAINAFKWAYDEMERRYVTLQRKQVRNIQEYNKLDEVKNGQEPKMSYVVIVVDELANLIMASPTNRKTLEDIIMAIASKARAAGIHLVLATQRPSVDVITGTIKANLPSRIAFAVTSAQNSRIILDSVGAETLRGRGDMLYAPADESEYTRIQGAYVENFEVKNIVDYVISHNAADFDSEFESAIAKKEPQKPAPGEGGNGMADDNGGYDKELIDVVRCVIKCGSASSSMIQRRFRFGWNKAARILEQMEELGFVGPQNGAKPREVVVTPEIFEEFFGEPYNE